ncbi:Baculoviral IAP repeat containing 7 [Mactra antiquata]
MNRHSYPFALGQNALVSGPSVAEKNHADVYFESFNVNGGVVNIFMGKSEPCMVKSENRKSETSTSDITSSRLISPCDKIENDTAKDEAHGTFFKYHITEVNPDDNKDSKETVPKTVRYGNETNEDHEDTTETQSVRDLRDDVTEFSLPSLSDQSDSLTSVQSNAFTPVPFDVLPKKHRKNSKINTAAQIHREVPFKKKGRLERKCNDVVMADMSYTENIIDNCSEAESVDSGVDSVISVSNAQINTFSKRINYHKKKCSKDLRKRKRFKSKRLVSDKRLNKTMQRKVKAVTRRLVFDENQPFTFIFGLGSYFDRLNTHPHPSLNEQMQYEWIRLASFQHYTGLGNSINLARQGFYHDQRGGSTSTRCAYCRVIVNDWEYHENIDSRHRRMSSSCPVYLDTCGSPLFINTRIPRGNGINFAQVQTTSSLATSVCTPVMVPSRLSTSVREVYRSTDIRGSLVNPQANPETVVAEVESRDDAETFSAFSPNEVTRRNFNLYQYNQPEDLGVSTRLRYQEEPFDHLRAVGGVGDMPSLNGGYISNVTGEQRCNAVSMSFQNQMPSNGMPITTEESMSSNIHTLSFHSVDRRENNTIDTRLTIDTVNADIIKDDSLLNLDDQREHGDGQETSGKDVDSDLSCENDCPGAIGGVDISSESSGHSQDTLNNGMLPHDNSHDNSTITMAQRFNSFYNFPEHLDLSPKLMALAGFSYTGVADCVRCFYCGIGIRDWTQGDDPFTEHKRWSPSCDYINSVSKNENKSPGSHEQKQENQRRNLARQKIQSMVPKRQDILFQKQDENKSKQRSLNTSNENILNDNDGNEHLLNSLRNETNNGQDNSLTGSNLTEETERLRSSTQCHVCLDKSKDVFLPCGHLVTCCFCLYQPLQCPICKSKIKYKKA